MIKRHLNIIRLAIAVVVGCSVLIIALYSAAFLWFFRVNTVVGVFSSATYKFYGQAQDLDKFGKLIAKIAAANRLEPIGDAGGNSAVWRRPTRAFNVDNLDLHISIESYPLTDDVSINRTFHVAVYSSDSRKSDEWQRVSKTIEEALMPSMEIQEVSVQFDSAAYGACASNERPEVADTVCSFVVTAPVDFNALNERIKLRKLNGGKLP
jgi:hypothetical protein